MKNSYYLATTGISKMWDLDTKLLMLGPWCLANAFNRKFIENKEYTLIPSPWKPEIKIKAAADYCHDIYKELLPILANRLNKLNKVDYPEKYWRVLIGYWLFTFIQQVYDKYIRIQYAAEKFPEFYTHVLPESQSSLISVNTWEFARNLSSDYYNLKLFSLICVLLHPNNVIVKSYHEQNEILHNRYSWIHKLAIKAIQKISSGNIILSDLYHISLINIVSLAWKSQFNVFTFMDFDPELEDCNHNFSPEIRSGIDMPSFPDPFRTLLCSLIPKALPVSFIEAYHAYKASIQKEMCKNPKTIGSVTGWYFNERFNFFAAEAVVKGAQLVNLQHGGGYGLSLSIPEERICSEMNVFFSWGWTKSGANNIIPLPSPYLSSLKNSHVKKSDEAIFVGTAIPPYVYRFDSGFFSEDIQEYFINKKKFILSLTSEIREKILYRPFPAKYGWEEKAFLNRIFPGVRYIEKGKLTGYMQKAKLAVFDHPHTSYIEALTINLPTILYWSHNIFLMRPEAEEFFELMRLAGILHRNPADAAKKVNEIFEDPFLWWQQPYVQDARKKFCERFALARKDWANEWINKFKSLPSYQS